MSRTRAPVVADAARGVVAAVRGSDGRHLRRRLAAVGRQCRRRRGAGHDLGGGGRHPSLGGTPSACRRASRGTLGTAENRVGCGFGWRLAVWWLKSAPALNYLRPRVSSASRRSRAWRPTSGGFRFRAPRPACAGWNSRPLALSGRQSRCSERPLFATGLDRRGIPGIGTTRHAGSLINAYEPEYLASIIFFCLNEGAIHAP